LFRLKQRDFDGKFSFSPLVEVSVGIGANVMIEPVQPNPVSHQGLVRFWTDKGSRVSLGLYSLYGQAVMEPIAMVTKGGQEQVLVDVSALSSGVYMLVLVVGGVSHSQKLVVTP
ncbi:MAG: T9SS type A sorting domain-containing protein, partial [Bacteroidia bacterium]|nr:T9SS type A sorting domain-containing protein [Bacteroidia bacterium]